MREGHVSIAMPVRDCASTVGAAIRSILNQTIDDWDLILIDDGTTDSTLPRVRSFSDDRSGFTPTGSRWGWPPDSTRRSTSPAATTSPGWMAMTSRIRSAWNDRSPFSKLSPDRPRGRADARLREGSQAAGVSALPGGPRADLRSSPFRLRPRPSHMVRPAQMVPKTTRTMSPLFGARTTTSCLRSYRESRFANVPAILVGYREERVDLRKVLSSRYHVVGSVARYAGGPMNRTTCLAAIEQVAKGLTDTLAVTFGAESVILRHRRRPLPSGRDPAVGGSLENDE